MRNILFINHSQKQCGVYQYGYRSAKILSMSSEYNFIYCEVDSEPEYLMNIIKYTPSGIIYNYHPSTLPWLTPGLISSIKSTTHYGIHHEGNDTWAMGFDYYVTVDCTVKDTDNTFSVPRPLYNNVATIISDNARPRIGSFGFGFHNKGFERLVKLVNEQFDDALIDLRIPFAYYGDMNGSQAMEVAERCRQHVTKPGITLSINHDFINEYKLLEFLAGNDLNAFLYDDMPGRGLSSVIDHALSVHIPIAISKSYMFRHIINTSPSICVEDRSLIDIINSGYKPLGQYRSAWSNDNFIMKYERILNATL